MPASRVIVCSKQRTLQLKSLLRSLFDLSDVEPEQVHVLYTSTPEIDYAPLVREFDRCRFVRQGQFLDDLRALAAAPGARYLSLLVDDGIFRERFSLREVERFLDRRPEIDCFSLRLGRHIEDGRAPEFERHDGGILSWRTAPGLGRTWNYFWEVSGSLYRAELVRDYLDACSPREVSFPNPLESVWYRRYPSYLGGWRNLLWAVLFPGRRSRRMACFETSRCLTQGVNLVADRGLDHPTLHTPEELHRKMLEGLRIDYAALRDLRNTRPNAGAAHFRLVPDRPAAP